MLLASGDKAHTGCRQGAELCTPCVRPCTPCVPCGALQGAGKGKALEFILKELKEVGAYPEAGVQVRLWVGGGKGARAAP